MSILMLQNNVAFWILRYRGELTTFEDFKVRSKYKLSPAWTEEIFNNMLRECQEEERQLNFDMDGFKAIVEDLMTRKGHTEADYINPKS